MEKNQNSVLKEKIHAGLNRARLMFGESVAGPGPEPKFSVLFGLWCTYHEHNEVSLSSQELVHIYSSVK